MKVDIIRDARNEVGNPHFGDRAEIVIEGQKWVSELPENEGDATTINLLALRMKKVLAVIC